MAFARLFTGGSLSLPLDTVGDACLLGAFTWPTVSEFAFVFIAAPGRDLPAESGLSGKVVLRFGGVSREKSGGITGCWGARGRGPGELGLDGGPGTRPFEVIRPADVEVPEEGNAEGAEFRRVGVDGRELDRVADIFMLEETCGLEFGVEGLELWDDRVLSVDDVLGAGRALDGVEGRDTVGLEDGVEGLAVDGERVTGEDGLI